jgi:SAM-dependent methyltransferase
VSAAYDDIGHSYGEYRRADPRLAAAIRDALGDARSAINVGAGAGSYEPADLDVLAIEPSSVMLGQRGPGAAPALRAPAESLPVGDGSFDAAMAVLTIQHWHDVERGLAELLRVARRRIVVVTMDVDKLAELWLIRDYVPELLATHAAQFPSIRSLIDALPDAVVSVLPVPRDCTDQFMAALWARPESYLDARVRAATSAWRQHPPAVVDRALAKLRRDIDTGAWHDRHGRLGRLCELDVGLRIVRGELRDPPPFAVHHAA